MTEGGSLSCFALGDDVSSLDWPTAWRFSLGDDNAWFDAEVVEIDVGGAGGSVDDDCCEVSSDDKVRDKEEADVTEVTVDIFPPESFLLLPLGGGVCCIQNQRDII